MGGTALGFEADRFNNEEFDKVYDDVAWMLQNRFGVSHESFGRVQSYHNKESHGDMDIVIVCNDAKWDEIRDGIELVNPASRNKNFYSFGWRYEKPADADGIPYSEKWFQIDLIRVDNLKAALTYYSYNDMGNLIGKIAHRCGFKYGWDGLKYIVHEKGDVTREIGEIIVSTNTEAIYSFLGYEYWRAENGFDDLHDIFEFVASSKYFDPKLYLFENLNAKARIRDRKRKNYNGFLEFCENRDSPDNYVEWNDEQKEAFKRYKLHEALRRFPGFRWNLIELQDEADHRAYFKTIYNGKIVGELTGLTGNDLGLFMEWVRKLNPDMMFDLCEDPRKVSTFVLREYRLYKERK